MIAHGDATNGPRMVSIAEHRACSKAVSWVFIVHCAFSNLRARAARADVTSTLPRVPPRGSRGPRRFRLRSAHRGNRGLRSRERHRVGSDDISEIGVEIPMGMTLLT